MPHLHPESALAMGNSLEHYFAGQFQQCLDSLENQNYPVDHYFSFQKLMLEYLCWRNLENVPKAIEVWQNLSSYLIIRSETSDAKAATLCIHLLDDLKDYQKTAQLYEQFLKNSSPEFACEAQYIKMILDKNQGIETLDSWPDFAKTLPHSFAGKFLDHLLSTYKTSARNGEQISLMVNAIRHLLDTYPISYKPYLHAAIEKLQSEKD